MSLKVKKTAISVIGGMNIDRKYYLKSDYMAGTSNPVTTSASVGGVARNIAENLGRLGCQVNFFSVAGNDGDYHHLVEKSQPYINMAFIESLSNKSTGNYTAILDKSGEMISAYADMDVFNQMNEEWLERYLSIISVSDLIVLDLNLEQTTVKRTIELARMKDIPLIIIPVSSPKMSHLPRELDGVTWLIINQDEVETFLGVTLNDSEDLRQAGQAFIDMGVEKVVVTQGTEPTFYMDKEGEAFYKPLNAEQVIDVTGAGDSYASGIIYGALQNKSSQECIEYGMVNAYHTVQTQATVRENLTSEQLEKDFKRYKQTKGDN